MQPRGECRIAAKQMDLAENMQEDFLRRILGFNRILQHAHAQGKYAPAVKLVEKFKRAGIAPLR